MPDSLPVFEIPEFTAGRQPTAADTVYVVVLTYTVPRGFRLHLHEISLFTSDFTRTRFRIEVAGVPKIDNFLTQTATTFTFPREAGVLQNEAITIRARSDDGVAVTATAMITGTLEPLTAALR